MFMLLSFRKYQSNDLKCITVVLLLLFIYVLYDIVGYFLCVISFVAFYLYVTCHCWLFCMCYVIFGFYLCVMCFVGFYL